MEDGEGMPKVETPHLEKAPVVVPKFELYTQGLVNRLEIPQEPQGESRNDLASWLSATSFMNKGEKAPLTGMLNFNSGQRTIELSSEKPLPEVINEKTSAGQLLEVQARTLAKLEFVAQSDMIPVEVRDQARKVTKMVIKESEKIQDALSQQVEVKVGRRVEVPKMTRRQALQALVTMGGGAVLAACNARVDALPATPINPGETPTPATETYVAPTERPTDEPTEIPQAEKIDAFDMSTWTPEMVGYYSKVGKDPAENAKLPLTDAEFNKKFFDGIRFGLLQRGINEINIDGRIAKTAEANEDDLFWGYIREAAKNQQEIYISPQYLRKLAADPRLENIPHWFHFPSNDVQAEYGLWAEWFDNTFGGAKIDTVTFATLQQFSTKTNVFGVEINTPYFTSRKTFADYAGFIRLPGVLEDYALLTRIKDIPGYSYLKVDSISIEKPVEFDSEMHSCLGLSTTTNEMYCPNYSVVTKGADYPNSSTTTKLWTKEEWLSRLNENFNFVILETPFVTGSDSEKGGHSATFLGFLNPNNGLGMIEKVIIASPKPGEYRRNLWPNPTS